MTTYLIRGMENQRKIEILISLTNIRSEKVIKVLNAYYCRGMSEKDIAFIYGVSQSNLNRDRNKLEEVAGLMEELFELKTFKSVK